MVYSSRFIMCVLRDGIPQQELGDGSVVLPFGSEYALRFRNKNPDRRAVVKVFIDGENVSAGGFVINANDKLDIERPVDNPVKFRFVSLDSSDAVDFGKNGPNTDRTKGVVEAHFSLEKPPRPSEHVDIVLEPDAVVLRLVLRGIDPTTAQRSSQAAPIKKRRWRRSSEPDLDDLQAEIETLKRRNAELELALLKKQRDELESKLGK
jgi:hypothetical protein